jgi:membrane peptidoglycan carboxypeptidase
MNVIYLGDGAYGVEAASETYFGVPVAKLTIAQDAVIAAIIQQPSNYYQPQYRPNLIARWRYVLNGMVTIGDLGQTQADGMKFPKLQTDSPSYSAPGLSTGCTTTSTQPWASYLMTEVCGELTQVDHVSQSELDNGGLKVITTVSLPMEKEIYKAVDDNIAQIKDTPGATVSTLPSWALLGAEVQDPKTGAIVALYPGRGEHMSTAKCKLYDCDQNTTLTREQVGSSFKPYVLATAVSEGMNVGDSILNSSEFLCVAPDSEPMDYSQAISGAVYDEPGQNSGCKNPESVKIENDGGGPIGTPIGPKGDLLWKSTVQNALAQSSNTAFTDLAHRATTASVIQMASNFGVDIGNYPNGSGLTNDLHQVPAVALGESSLTVNEQTQMLATIDDNGVFHAGHVIKSWQRPDETAQSPVVASHLVLTQAQDSQVQYAMEDTVYHGTAVNASAGLGGRQIIAKTGTTSNYLSGFFVGAIPQYAMVVGLFVNQQDSSNLSVNNLSDLGGGGFGGFWPANIWNTFAQAEWAKLTPQDFLNPQFSGQLWNQIGPIPKAKKKKKPAKCTVKIHGKSFPVPGKGCPGGKPTPTPTPTPSNTQPTGFPTFPGQTPTPTTSTTPTPTTSVSSTPTTSTSSTPTAPSTATSTPGFPGGFGGNTADAAKTATGVKASLAVGGLLATLLPGSLLWTSSSRRRRKRRAGTNR